ncbi:hypothetical protein AMECASPLE_025612 [Ameca splendens]|uniref:Uncharacterized protein n=1 Tax=Ameca splendens TaxID=208324 RepID=A0ABV1A2Q1_9TELE
MSAVDHFRPEMVLAQIMFRRRPSKDCTSCCNSRSTTFHRSTGSSWLTFPPSRTCTSLGSEKGQLTSLQTPHILDTNCLDVYLQVDATKRAKTNGHRHDFFP